MNSLVDNKKLTSLNYCINYEYIGNNGIGDQGAKYISEILQINDVLVSLNLGKEFPHFIDENGIKDEGARYISNALKVNRKLTSLTLSNTNY